MERHAVTTYILVNLILSIMQVVGFTLASWGTFASSSPRVYGFTPAWVRWAVCRHPRFLRPGVAKGQGTSVVMQGYIWAILAVISIIHLAIILHGIK